MVFGVFDRLHPGHLDFLKQAKKLAAKLIIVVARNSAVHKLKKKSPQQSELQRIFILRGSYETRSHKIDSGEVKVILGDKKQGSYGVIKKYKPDVIGLGYDQKWLEKDLKKRVQAGFLPKFKILKLRSYQPGKFHTSKLK